MSIRETQVPVGWYLPEDSCTRTGIGGEAVHDDGLSRAGGFVRVPVNACLSRTDGQCVRAIGQNCRVRTIGSFQASREVPPAASDDIARSNSGQVTTSGLKN
jgi:hypothetical protein